MLNNNRNPIIVSNAGTGDSNQASRGPIRLSGIVKMKAKNQHIVPEPWRPPVPDIMPRNNKNMTSK